MARNRTTEYLPLFAAIPLAMANLSAVAFAYTLDAPGLWEAAQATAFVMLIAAGVLSVVGVSTRRPRSSCALMVGWLATLGIYVWVGNYAFQTRQFTFFGRPPLVFEGLLMVVGFLVLTITAMVIRLIIWGARSGWREGEQLPGREG